MSGGRRRGPPPRARRKPGARELALQILLAIETRSAYSDRVLETKLREAAVAPLDAALVTTLVQG
jgi:hypothetical protein